MTYRMDNIIPAVLELGLITSTYLPVRLHLFKQSADYKRLLNQKKKPDPENAPGRIKDSYSYTSFTVIGIPAGSYRFGTLLIVCF